MTTTHAIEPRMELEQNLHMYRQMAKIRAFEEQVKPLLQTYCLDCHGGKKVKGDTNLRWLSDGEAALRDQQLIRHALNKLRSHEMPPPEERQPTDAERAQAGAWRARGA